VPSTKKNFKIDFLNILETKLKVCI